MRAFCWTTAASLVLLVPPVTSAQGVSRMQRGDTVVLHTTGQGRWGAPKRAVEVLRVSGPRGEEEFGRIDCISALPDGGVVVYDAQGLDGPMVIVINGDGTTRRTLGRVGAGPGEYRPARLSTCLAVQGDGTILFLDTGNSRIDRWSAKGEVLPAIPLSTPLVGPEPNILPGTGGSIYVRGCFGRPRRQFVPWHTDFAACSFLHISAEGTVLDTVNTRRTWSDYQVPREFDPWDITLPLEDGTLFVSAADRLAFLLRSRTGRAVLIEHPTDPVPVTAAERKEWTAIKGWYQGSVPPPAPSFANTKSAFFAVARAHDGTIWLKRHVAAVRDTPREAFPGVKDPPSPIREWFEPPVFAAFLVDGTYLGEAQLPLHSRMHAFTGAFAWGIAVAPDGQEALVRWRLR